MKSHHLPGCLYSWLASSRAQKLPAILLFYGTTPRVCTYGQIGLARELELGLDLGLGMDEQHASQPPNRTERMQI